MTRIRARLRRARDGGPCSHSGAIHYTADRIREASIKGVGLYLSAEMVRALDWSVIREAGGIDTAGWRDGPCLAGNPNE